jgi:putative ABC transport system permease protein
MLKDILMQAWEAMVFNRRRTTITIIGMAWGIATVVLLLAYGAGFNRAIEAIFAQLGHDADRRLPRPHQRAGRRRQGRRQGALHAGRCGCWSGTAFRG